MRFSTSFVVFAGTFLINTSAGDVLSGHFQLHKHRSLPSTPATELYQHLQASTRDLRGNTPSMSYSQMPIDAPTPTSPLNKHADSQLHARSTSRPRGSDRTNGRRGATRIVRIQIFTYLKKCRDGVRIRVKNITSLCTNLTDKSNAEDIAWKLVAELQAILTLFLTCIKNIKKCSTAPTPSGMPNRQSPNGASLVEISRIIFQIMREIRICFQALNKLCSKYDIVRSICRDSLQKISVALSDVVTASNRQVDGVVENVNKLCGNNPANFFGFLGFGLKTLIEVLKGEKKLIY